ncbi:hypothetical protein [Pseudomonas sp. S9]|uniref:hypothetical protein n=1 Tax=Pseudomonas sp. S9 TaxID=686578 RepID=UPI0002557002|nr:hypothetical protein [Pseudomonas sp. S9]
MPISTKLHCPKAFLTLLIAIPTLMTACIAVAAPKLWVTADQVARHTCPSDECGVAGYLMFREGVQALETKGSWVRITKPYTASCVGGNSKYVKSGNPACVANNGITEGVFAEWVSTKSLSTNRPVDPAQGATGDDALVKGSDDYRLYKNQFTKAARELINNGTCSTADFEEIGGWMASPAKDQGMYFTYCGGMTTANRLYLDVNSGKVSR